MKFKDHKNVSQYLVESLNCKLKFRHRWALVIGSVIPDITVYTYFRRSDGGQKLRGHNYENSMDCMKQLVESVNNDKANSIMKYIHVGMLLHYSADSFTYAHNSHFKGTIGEHREYEMRLHEELEEAMRNNISSETLNEVNDIFARIKELHDMYLKEIPCCQIDCAYIFDIVTYIFILLVGGDYAQHVQVNAA